MNGDREVAARICLNYYDAAYGNQLVTRFGEHQIKLEHIEVKTLDFYNDNTIINELISISLQKNDRKHKTYPI